VVLEQSSAFNASSMNKLISS